jgi:PUA domain protein
MGAVPHIADGADVMAPGVVSVDEDILPGDGVVIVDERHGKPLAIGLALVAGADMKAPKGKVIKNLHHVGDEIWSLGRGKS